MYTPHVHPTDMVHVYPTLVDGLDHPAPEQAIQRAVDFMLCVTTNPTTSHTTSTPRHHTYHPPEECGAGAACHLHTHGSTTLRSPTPRRQLALADDLSSMHARGDWSPANKGALRVVRSPSSPRDACQGLAGVLDAVAQSPRAHYVPPGSPSLSEASSVTLPWRGEILAVGGLPAPGLPVESLPMALPLWEGACELVLPSIKACEGKSEAALCFEGCSMSTRRGMVGVDWSADHAVLQLML